MKILDPVAKLIKTSAAFRFVAGFMVVFPLLSGAAFTFKTTIATFTPREDYFDYAPSVCRHDDGSLQVRAVEYVQTIKYADAKIGIELASCSLFKRPLPVEFHDRMFCQNGDNEFVLVSSQTESIKEAKVGTEYKSKHWLYTSGIYLGTRCYVESLITVTDGLVNKSQSIVSDVFVTNVKE